MSDVIHFEGVEYISSKRASDLSGYNQDYIGQLARSGKIKARRVGGLWYIQYESLELFESSEEKNNLPVNVQNDEINETKKQISSIVFFDGKEYISAAEASKSTGYHQDYIGQLSRGGKIPARLVGKRWFVSRRDILAHKREKDALLAAVQTDAVGLYKHDSAPQKPSLTIGTYSTQKVDLFPETGKKEGDLVTQMESSNVTTATRSAIPITIRPLVEKNDAVKSPYRLHEVRSTSPKKQVKYSKIAVTFATIVLIVGIAGLVSLRAAGSLTYLETREVPVLKLTASSGSVFDVLIEKIEFFLSKEGGYVRK